MCGESLANCTCRMPDADKVKRVYILQNLGCANCAAKIETAVKALPGVKNASVSFMAQKMLLEADDDKFDAVLKDAVKAAKKVEPDFEIEL